MPANALAVISIHVPREGDDYRRCDLPVLESHFYPRPPRGGRHLLHTGPTDDDLFLSTSPARGTTQGPGGVPVDAAISIHVPREGDDTDVYGHGRVSRPFLSTSPARGTTAV